MGYACPVCDAPQVDDRHLANHVAFSALTGDATHEEWVDEHVPGWGRMGEEDLAAELVEDAEEIDVETVFEASGTDAPVPDRRSVPPTDVDEAAAEVLAEARDLTRRMTEGRQEPDEGDHDEGDEGDHDDGDGGARGTDGSAADETE